MEKLKLLIEQHGHWKGLDEYINRIEGFADDDFSVAVGSAKSLLETIAKEICKLKNIDIAETEKIGTLLKKAFTGLGYTNDDLVRQISGALANIAQQMGTLRNEIDIQAHGKSLDEIRERNKRVDNFTKEFLIDSTELVACFLIRNHELDTPLVLSEDERLVYEECVDFNQEWDDIYGEVSMGGYVFSASEILFALDYNDYVKEFNAFQVEPPEL
jgi:hypothetical protein